MRCQATGHLKGQPCGHRPRRARGASSGVGRSSVSCGSPWRSPLSFWFSLSCSPEGARRIAISRHRNRTADPPALFPPQSKLGEAGFERPAPRRSHRTPLAGGDKRGVFRAARPLARGENPALHRVGAGAGHPHRLHRTAASQRQRRNKRQSPHRLIRPRASPIGEQRRIPRISGTLRQPVPHAPGACPARPRRRWRSQPRKRAPKPQTPSAACRDRAAAPARAA